MKKKESDRHSRPEKGFLPSLFQTSTPTNPHPAPFLHNAPEGLALVCSAPNPSEAEVIRQILRDADFHVEYVAAITTGIFGTSGNSDVFVRAEEEQEAREFLSQLQKQNEEGGGDEGESS